MFRQFRSNRRTWQAHEKDNLHPHIFLHLRFTVSSMVLAHVHKHSDGNILFMHGQLVMCNFTLYRLIIYFLVCLFMILSNKKYRTLCHSWCNSLYTMHVRTYKIRKCTTIYSIHELRELPDFDDTVDSFIVSLHPPKLSCINSVIKAYLLQEQTHFLCTTLFKKVT